MLFLEDIEDMTITEMIMMIIIIEKIDRDHLVEQDLTIGV